MEWDIRDWLMVIGGLLFLAVLLDGYRRARNERRNQVRLSRNAKRMQSSNDNKKKQNAANAAEGEEEKEVKEFTSELPNGGARVVERREDSIDPLNPPEIVSERVDLAKKQTDASQLAAGTSEKIEPVISDETLVVDEPYSVDPLFADPFDKPKDKPKATKEAVDLSGKDAETAQATKSDGVNTSDKAKSRKAKEEIQPSLFDQPNQQQEPEKIVVLNVLATDKDKGFSGEELLHILLACDCRFGEMNIFHRYESENAQGEIQFSIVNLVEPGIFDLQDIKNFSTPGVSFFYSLAWP